VSDLKTERSNLHLEIAEGWGQRLNASGVASFEDLMRFDGGQCLSWHAGRSETRSTVLPCGQRVFVKKALATERTEMLRDMLAGRRPCSMIHKEHAAMQVLAGMGIGVAEVIAFGQRHFLNLPTQGVMVALPVEGTPLNELLANAQQPLIKDVLRNLAAAMAKVFQAGWCWPDLLPRHVFAQDGAGMALIDLERMHRPLFNRRSKQARSLRRFISAMTKDGATDEHVRLAQEAFEAAGCRLT